MGVFIKNLKNITFIGRETVEFLIPVSYKDKFCNLLTPLMHRVTIDDCSPVLFENQTSKLDSTIAKERFARRIARNMNSPDEKVKDYFLQIYLKLDPFSRKIADDILASRKNDDTKLLTEQGKEILDKGKEPAIETDLREQNFTNDDESIVMGRPDSYMEDATGCPLP
jgi:hypothetical protein